MSQLEGPPTENDARELARFAEYLKRRHDAPAQPAFVTYGDVYGEVVFEDRTDSAKKGDSHG